MKEFEFTPLEDSKSIISEIENTYEEDRQQRIKKDEKESSSFNIFDEEIKFEGLCAKGDILEGKIIDIDKNYVYVDINQRTEGVVDKKEFASVEIKKGDKISVYVVDTVREDEPFKLSYIKAKQHKAWKNILSLYHSSLPVKARVVNEIKNKSGYTDYKVKIDDYVYGILPEREAFLDRNQKKIENIIGKELEFNILKIDEKGIAGTLILSRKSLLIKEKEEKKENFFQKYKEGSIVEGHVKSIANFGVFVDIDGVDGLLHISNVSWGRVERLEDEFEIGQKIKVKILSLDKKENKISLGTKHLTENPWQSEIAEKRINETVTAEISDIKRNLIKVKLADNTEGIIPVEEISWSSRNSIDKSKYKVGKKINAKIIKSDINRRVFVLSIKQLIPNPWKSALRRFKVNDEAKGYIVGLNSGGIVVELIKFVQGFIPANEISWENKKIDVQKEFTLGEEIKFKIIKITESKKEIICSLRQLQTNPIVEKLNKYKEKEYLTVKIKNIQPFGAFAEIEPDIDGLIPIREASSKSIDKIGDILKEGDKVNVKIIEIDPFKKKIILSIKEYLKDKETKEVQEYMARQQEKSSVKIGDLFSEKLKNLMGE